MTAIEKLHVTVWGEFRHEKTDPRVAALYPRGMHEAIAAPLCADAGLAVRTATLDEPEHGLSAAVLDETDVLAGQLRKDEAIAEADTLLLTIPNQLGVAYNVHLLESVLAHVAPALGWR